MADIAAPEADSSSRLSKAVHVREANGKVNAEPRENNGSPQLDLEADSEVPTATTVVARIGNASVEAVRGRIVQLFELMLLAGIVAISVLATAEIGARSAFAIYLTQQLSLAREEAVERGTRANVLREQDLQRRAAGPSTAAPSKPIDLSLQIDSSLQEAITLHELAEHRVAALKRAEQYLRRLSLVGATSKSPQLAEVMVALDDYLGALGLLEANATSNGLGLKPILGFDVPDDTLFQKNDIGPILQDLIGSFYFFGRLGNEQLFAGSIVLAATLGALLAVLRRNDFATVRTVTLGAATGFIVYLTIKGGRYVFLMQLHSEQAALNPYSSAFAALLAGLFSQTAYGLLSTLVAGLSERINLVVSSSRQQANDKKDGHE
jgi:hypothetical protein